MWRFSMGLPSASSVGRYSATSRNMAVRRPLSLIHIYGAGLIREVVVPLVLLHGQPSIILHPDMEKMCIRDSVQSGQTHLESNQSHPDTHISHIVSRTRRSKPPPGSSSRYDRWAGTSDPVSYTHLLPRQPSKAVGWSFSRIKS